MPENLVSFSISLPPPFPAASLTSLIYGEQSEKSSPSEISLEAERRDRVSTGSGLGPEGPPNPGQAVMVHRVVPASSLDPRMPSFHHSGSLNLVQPCPAQPVFCSLLPVEF